MREGDNAIGYSIGFNKIDSCCFEIFQRIFPSTLLNNSFEQNFCFQISSRERSGSVVECLTGYREAAG